MAKKNSSNDYYNNIQGAVTLDGGSGNDSFYFRQAPVAGCIIDGGSGTEYITPRLGDDVVYAGAGNDLLVGNEGADKLYGEQGDDIFLITRLATKANGGTFSVGKASDGTAELVSGDVMDGGNGIDELRITASGSTVTPIPAILPSIRPCRTKWRPAR